jgi:hypothetical protein
LRDIELARQDSATMVNVAYFGFIVNRLVGAKGAPK